MTTKVIKLNCFYSSSTVEIPFSDKYDFLIGDTVIFKDEGGREEAGVVKAVNCDATDKEKVLFESKVLRKATPNDLQKIDGCFSSAEVFLDACRKTVKKLELDMNVFVAGCSFDGTKAHFLFTSEDRVDFRDLVKDLAKILQKQIHLRQIGPRDKAKLVSGYGKCGQPLCCSFWLKEMESVGMDMVRAQGLEGKGSLKLSGSCGKLLCCLKYEVELYKEFKKSLPKIGAKVKVKGKDGEGFVSALDILNQKIRVSFARDDFCVFEPKDIEKVLPNNPVKS